jgi:hypothetical protein
MTDETKQVTKKNDEKDDSHLLWDCFVNWALTLEKTDNKDLKN